MLTVEERVLCGNPLQRFGSGLEPDPEPTREFGPVANTSNEVPECPEQQDVSAAPNVPREIQPTRKSKRQAEKVLVTVSAIETERHKGVKKMQDRMRQCFTCCFMYLDRDVQLEIYYGQMVSSSLWISVDKHMYTRCNESFGMICKFLLCASEHCRNVTALGFPTKPNLNLAETPPFSSHHDENYYRWQQMLNRQYIEWASTECQRCVVSYVS